MRKTALLLILLAAGAFPAAAPGAKGKAVRAAQQLPHEAIALTPGVEATYSLPSVTSATLWNGNLGFSIVVPSGATQLRVEINGPSNADVDLYIRYGLDVTVSGGDVVADYFSEGLTSSESITIPSPRAGTYFIAFGLYTNGVTVTGRILGTVTGGGGTGGGGSGGGSGGGATITGITLSGGSFSSSGLINNGSYWDTIPSTSSWVLGVSAPPVSSPLLNAANKSVNIPAGTYYTYNEPASFGTAVQIAINWSDGRPNDVAIFQVASLVTFGNWTRLSGSTAISLAATGITNANRVALGLTSGGANDNVLQLTVGSPAGGGGTGGTGTGTNLLTNGGFELPGNNGSYISLGTGSPGLTGWRITSGDLDYIGNLWTPSEGKSSLDMNGVSAATIAQTFATVEGTTYTVSFDLAGNPAGGPAIKTLRSLAAGQSRDFQFDATSKSFTSMGWIRQSWTFTANSSSTVLSFESRIGGIYGPALDNVVVTGPGSGGSPALQLSFNGIDAGGRVNFLPVNVGRTATVSLTVRNPGTAPVTVISISSTNPVFSATPQTLTIEPGGTRPLDVSFLPVAERSELGVMTLNLAGGGTAVLNLSGSGVAAPGGSGGGNAGSNLLQNGGADAAAVTGCGIPASIPGWNTDGRVAVCSYAAGGGYPTAADPGPPARGANFFAGGRSATSSMNQTVSLAANAAQIETGSFPYTLSAYLGGFAGDTDNARITLTFLRENGTVTGTAIIGPVTPADRANRTGLFLRSTGGNVPTGTRSARVTVDFTRGSGDANDGYADDISFALGAGGGTSGGGTGGGTTPPGTTPGCNYLVSLNPSSPTRIDGTRQTGLVTIFTGAACDWTASFNDSWITIEAGRSGRGPGAVSYRAEANPDARERTGTMTVAGQTFTFIQGAGAPCTYTIAPESLPAPVAATGGGGAIVLTTGATCAWAASSNASWLSANPPSGAGGRTLQWTASPNTSATGRTGVITFTGGRTFTVIQSPAGASGGPNVTPGGVVGAASGIPPSLPGGALALGSFFSIFAEGVGPNPPVQATSFPLPTNLGGTSVRIRQGNSSVDAYLVFSSASQINGIVPSNAPLGDAELIVTFNGRSTPPVAVRTVRNNLGIFSVGGGRGPGIIQNFIAPTDQPLNTRNATAKPRQIITLWGTGAGPINTPDNVAPPVGDLPYEFELQIGGKRARLLYNGRAPCCSGVDQIVAEIPADVPFGCSVPVQARAGELWSNTVTMAISADGSPCSDPRNPLASIPQSGGKIGVVSLLRAGASLRTAEGLQTLSVDLGVGLFTDVAAGGELGFSPLTALPPPGSCQTYASTQDLTSLISGALPGGTLNGAKMLNAGSQLTVTPSGGRALPLARTDDGTYMGLLGGGIPGLGSTPLVLNAGTFRIAGPGGADVGNFQVDVTLGPPLVWSNREQLTSIDRRQPFDITWTGGGADQNVLIAGLSSDQTTKATAVFVCLAPAAAGRFSVPPSAMSNLPTAPAIADFEKRFGLVVVGSLRTGNFPVFSAQGIGSGIVMPASLDMRTVEVK